jgi:hypothetical protein
VVTTGVLVWCKAGLRFSFEAHTRIVTRRVEILQEQSKVFKDQAQAVTGGTDGIVALKKSLQKLYMELSRIASHARFKPYRQK